MKRRPQVFTLTDSHMPDKRCYRDGSMTGKDGKTLKKAITLIKGPEAMDNDNIPMILKSACKYDPTGYQETIADTVLISAHFVPACGNVNIKSPTGQWILNTKSPLNDDDKRYLPLVIDQFDLKIGRAHV